MKECADCNEVKSFDCFYLSYRRKDGSPAYFKRCKPCHIESTNDWSRWNPQKRKAINKRSYDKYGDKRRNRAREAQWRKYGLEITLEQYEEMHESQEGLCQLCGRPEKPGRLLAVDHDHVTGAIRGLLCFKCNTTLGWVEDNPDLIQNILDYLQGDPSRGQHLHHVRRGAPRVLPSAGP